MKKHFLIAFAIFISAVVMAGTIRYGFGKVITATTTKTVQKIGIRTNDYASKMSVHNTGTNTLYIAGNCTTDQFIATNSVPVAAGSTYTFMEGPQYKSICFATLEGTTTFNLAAE